ncbi:hypothetical protein TorRG33x02_307560 [Trema orientale]|uniref:Uncharacterized protein n=1 Tax=Trema orientale TaxID=63057 RepID=A0A2P5BV96_TREOI|nr:hypothetical protein TorRG33x02_307560 [Trema orientale]
MQRCISNGVKFHNAKISKLDQPRVLNVRDSHLGNEHELHFNNLENPNFSIQNTRIKKVLHFNWGPSSQDPRSVVAIHRSSGEIHLTTGYMLARTMGSAAVVAVTILRSALARAEWLKRNHFLAKCRIAYGL